MNIGRYLRGEDMHIGTARITYPCKHPNAIREEHLTGEGSMEYVEWYDYYCPDCKKEWTQND